VAAPPPPAHLPSSFGSLAYGPRLGPRESDKPCRPCTWSQRELQRERADDISRSAYLEAACAPIADQEGLEVTRRDGVATLSEPGLGTPEWPRPAVRYPIGRCSPAWWDIPWDISRLRVGRLGRSPSFTQGEYVQCTRGPTVHKEHIKLGKCRHSPRYGGRPQTASTPRCTT
jgi:hypothetical protein